MLVSNLAGITDRTAFNESKILGNDENKRKTVEDVERLVFSNTHETIKSILKV